MHISDRLKAVLADQGLNIKTFAERSDLPYRTAQSYLNGERLPNAEGFFKLATHLCIDITWLITGTGTMYRDAGPADRPPDPGRDDAGLPGASKEAMQAWLEAFFREADERQRAWLEIEFGRAFPEYLTWLNRQG